MQKPQINVIKPDIKNLSIYLRSTKKFGKTTLFRDMILAKYGDASRGLLVGCGNEVGYKMLDNLNVTQVKTYKDLTELADWLISQKGKEHNIEIIGFDTGDELALITDAETIRQSNIENPNKKCKSIKGAFGGFTAGEKFSANDLIKPYMARLENAGFGVWVISHTKFKTIKEKGGLDEDGYMQLTSNMGADYEAAFGDIFDVTLTGVIDRDLEEKKVGDKTKKYATDTVRKLYFRGTTLIDAGGRFADGAVPEYMIFDKPDMGAEFVKVIEEGMAKSKTFTGKAMTSSKPLVNENTAVIDNNIDEELLDELDEEINDTTNEPTSEYPDDLVDAVREMFKKRENDSLKAEIREVVKKHGRFDDVPEDELKELYDKLNA